MLDVSLRFIWRHHANRCLADPHANLLNGQDHSEGKLEFLRADGEGQRVRYYEVELKNVIISNIDQVLSDGNILLDEIGLSYSRVKWKYTQQKIAGGAGGNTAGGWCLASNKCVSGGTEHPMVKIVYFNDERVQKALGGGRVKSLVGHNNHFHAELWPRYAS